MSLSMFRWHRKAALCYLLLLLSAPLLAQVRQIQTVPGTWSSEYDAVAALDGQFIFRSRPDQAALWRFDARNGQLQRLSEGALRSAQAASEGVYWIEAAAGGRMHLKYWKSADQSVSVLYSGDEEQHEWLGVVGVRGIVRIGQQVWSTTPSGSYEYLHPAGQISIGQGKLTWKDNFVWFDSGLQQLVITGGDRQSTRVLGQFAQAYYFTPLGNQLLFHGDRQLCRTDGTPEGTRAFFPLGRSNPSLPSGIILGDSVLLFTGGIGDAGTGVELWRTNGTQSGTFELRDLSPGIIPNAGNYPFSGSPQGFIRRDNQVWFIALDRNNDYILWRSDGTSTGTTPVENLRTAHNLLDIEYFQRIDDGRQVAIVNTAHQGRELALFDGDMMVYDLRPNGGAGYSNTYWDPAPVWAAGNTLWARANNGQHGQELWRLQPDGNAAMTGDVSAGGAWSFPRLLGIHEGQLYWLTGNPGQPLAIYQVGLEATLPAPAPVKQSIDWQQTIRVASGNASMGRWLYNSGLARTDGGSLYVSGAGNNFFRQGVGFTKGAWNNPRREYLGDNFLARLNPQGEPEWAIHLPGYHHLTVGHFPLAPAPNEGVYAGFVAYGRGSLDNVNTLDFGQGTGLVLRYSATGQLQWSQRCQIGSGRMNQLATDTDGNAIVAGTFTDFNAQVAGKTLTARTSPAYFVAKFSPDGRLLWATAIEAGLDWPALGPVNGMTVDASGQVFFLTGNAGQNTEAPCRFGAIFGGVTCLGADGSLRWQRIWQGNDLWFPTSIALAPRGELYVGGRFRGELTVDGRSIRHVQDENCSGSGFLAHLTPEGEALSLRQIDEEGMTPHSIQCDEQGNYWVAGYREKASVAIPPRFRYQPFSTRYGEVVVQAFSPQHILLATRSFRVQDKFDNGGTLKLIRQPNQKLLLSGEYIGMVDTLAEGDGGSEQHVFLMQFDLPFTVPTIMTDGDLADADVRLNPNPAHDFADLTSADPDILDREVRVYDVAGRQMSVPVSRYGSGQLRLNVRELPAGVYWVTLPEKDRAIVRKLVIFRSR